jgi:hypothetical protein
LAYHRGGCAEATSASEDILVCQPCRSRQLQRRKALPAYRREQGEDIVLGRHLGVASESATAPAQRRGLSDAYRSSAALPIAAAANFLLAIRSRSCKCPAPGRGNRPTLFASVNSPFYAIRKFLALDGTRSGKGNHLDCPRSHR